MKTPLQTTNKKEDENLEDKPSDYSQEQSLQKLLGTNIQMVKTLPTDNTGKLDPIKQVTFDQELWGVLSLFDRAKICTSTQERTKVFLNAVVTHECQRQILAIIKMGDEYDDTTTSPNGKWYSETRTNCSW